MELDLFSIPSSNPNRKYQKPQMELTFLSILIPGVKSEIRCIPGFWFQRMRSGDLS